MQFGVTVHTSKSIIKKGEFKNLEIANAYLQEKKFHSYF